MIISVCYNQKMKHTMVKVNELVPQVSTLTILQELESLKDWQGD